MVFPKVVRGLLVVSLCVTSSWAQYGADYDGSYDASYRGADAGFEEPRGAYRGDDVPAASVERASPAVAPAYSLHSHAPAFAPQLADPAAFAPQAAPAYAPVFPSSDTSSYHLYHRDHPQAQVEMPEDDAPQNDHKHHGHDHKHHGHDHGTSSMSFYQKVKHHDYKFKLEQKHGKKHGSFHGLAHPYAYGGLKVHNF